MGAFESCFRSDPQEELVTAQSKAIERAIKALSSSSENDVLQQLENLRRFTREPEHLYKKFQGSNLEGYNFTIGENVRDHPCLHMTSIGDILQTESYQQAVIALKEKDTAGLFDALHYIHSCGVVHDDIAIRNILYWKDCWVLIDFDCAILKEEIDSDVEWENLIQRDYGMLNNAITEARAQPESFE